VMHSKHSIADRRVQRTRKLLQDAFIEMTIQKGFAAVTVQDVTEQAGVNRATFYRHYLDKFDLLDQFAQEVYQLLDTPDEASAPENQKSTNAERLPAGMVKLFEHVRAHATFYRVMLGKNGDPGFGAKMQRYIETRLRQSLPEAQGSQPLEELYLSYVSSGSIGLVLWWLEHETSYSPTTMAAVAMRLSAADLRAVLGQDGLVEVGE
jgi:AcrR family transcriptional regulator